MGRGLLALLSFGLWGCDEHEYGVTIWNKSGDEIEEATVRYGELHTVGGYIVAGGQVTHLLALPFPDRVSVAWRSVDGEMHRVEKEVARWIKKGKRFEGKLFFIINPDGTVSFVAARDRTDGGYGYPTLEGLVEAADGKAYEPKDPV